MAVAARRRRPDDDVEEEETPRARRRRPADEEEDRRPRRRRPESGDDDDDTEEPPRRRRASREEEDDDDEDVEEAPRGRRAREDDDEEEDRPRRRPGGSKGPAGPAGRRPGGSKSSGRVARGWDGYNKVKSASSDFEKKFKPSKDGEVVLLLEEAPFAAFARHWVDLSEGKRAFICPASLETDEDEAPPECPLCDVGDKPNGAKAYINVLHLKPREAPEHAVWEIGGSVSDQLQTIDKSIGRRTSLTEIYLLASSSGSGLNTKYILEPLFEEDLGEFNVKIPTEKQLKSIELHDDSIYEIPSLKELNRVADEIA